MYSSSKTIKFASAISVYSLPLRRHVAASLASSVIRFRDEDHLHSSHWKLLSLPRRVSRRLESRQISGWGSPRDTSNDRFCAQSILFVRKSEQILFYVCTHVVMESCFDFPFWKSCNKTKGDQIAIEFNLFNESINISIDRCESWLFYFIPILLSIIYFWFAFFVTCRLTMKSEYSRIVMERWPTFRSNGSRVGILEYVDD